MNEFISRRRNILEKLNDGAALILYSGKAKRQSGDNFYPYFANRSFYYFTNIDQENSILVLAKNRASLYIDEYSEHFEKWFGKKITVEQAKKISSLVDIRLTKDFAKDLEEIKKIYKNVYLELPTDEDFIKELINTYSPENVNDATPLIRDLRMKKDELEINNIIEAIKVTHLGLKRIIKELVNSDYEYEIYNSFNHEIMNHGTHEIGFPSIIASGVNATCLHYPTPYSKIENNSLVLCDVGASYNHYSSDITRTYPKMGRYSDISKSIYKIVLECNKAVIDYIKPGLTLADLQNFAKEFLAAKCLQLGIINNKNDIEKYYYHGVSHHLGLDTHDLSDRNKPLEEGNVITVEPGLYIKEKNIGVRIEDDVLVTKEGSRCLSSFVEKEIEDIEKLF